MKKYLIKGLLLFVVGALTASCADKDVDYVPLDQQKATAYADAFRELIGGEVAPNHDWGFKKTSIIEDFSQTRAKTRDVNVNGNMWDSRPELGATEERDVLTFMDMTLAEMTEAGHAYSKNFPVNMPNFFVTQVHTGDDWYGSAQSPNNKTNLGSSFMNELVIAITPTAARTNNTIASNTLPEADSWYHVNNFNAGSSKDWGGNTKFINMGTCDFAYHNSKDSRFHNRWIVVSGADIDAALGVNKYTGYYYVCFDFQSQVPDGQTDKTYFSFRDSNGNAMQSYNGEIEGFYQTAQDIIDAGITQIRGYDGNMHDVNVIEDFTVTRWEYDDKIIPGDNNYSDWIIRLCAATPESNSSTTVTRTDRIERRRLVAQGRIFCEDLGTTTVTTSDIDFNDAVFDAKIWRKGQFDVGYVDNTYNSESDYLENIYTTGINGIDFEMHDGDTHVIVNGKFKYVAEICLLAAGGTVPLKIGGDDGFEIHSKFGEGQKPSRNIAHTTIINTMGAPSQANFSTTVQTDVCDAVITEVDITNLVKNELDHNNTDISLDIIPIEVQWVSSNHESVGQLSANYGETPQKLCVPIGTRWVYERIPVTSAYKQFDSYATSKSPLFWEGTKDESLLYPSSPEGLTPETGETGSIASNPFHDEVVIEGETTTTTEVETVLWEGTNTYGSGGNNGEDMRLYSNDFSNDDKTYVRVYATLTGNDVNFQIKEDPGWNTIMTFLASDHNGQYFEKKVDSTFANSITTLIHSWGRDCTITKICKVVRTSSTGD